MIHTGACHCGAIKVALSSDKTTTELPLRACECGFCRPQRARYTSDPAGNLKITGENGADITCYRFGTKTADFMRCGTCGVLIGAKCEVDGALFVVVSAALFDGFHEREADAADFDGERVGDRLARRAKTWTPATVEAATATQRR